MCNVASYVIFKRKKMIKEKKNVNLSTHIMLDTMEDEYLFQWYIRKFRKKACNSISCKVVFIKSDNRNCQKARNTFCDIYLQYRDVLNFSKNVVAFCREMKLFFFYDNAFQSWHFFKSLCFH